MVFCSKCGSENKDASDNCENCGEYLLKSDFFEPKNMEKFENIFSKDNEKVLNEITDDAYVTVMNNIIKMGHDHLNKILSSNNINVNELSILNKIEIVTQSYVQIHYKTSGAELGSYSFNSILVDDRLYESQQIATLIHELSHHLFSEIFEELLMYVWECGKSDALEALAWYIVTGNPLIKLANEYCAHTCEGRFIPHGYQNYGSFNNILENEFDPKKDKEQIDLAFLFGNTMAKDIIFVLEGFINPSLREEIKQQFKEDSFPPRYDQIIQEIKDQMPDEIKIKIITDIISAGYKSAQEQNMHEVLENFKHTFTEVNKISNTSH